MTLSGGRRGQLPGEQMRPQGAGTPTAPAAAPTITLTITWLLLGWGVGRVYLPPPGPSIFWNEVKHG